MDSGSGSLLPRVSTTGGRTAVRAMFAQASNAFLSPLDTQKKKRMEDSGHLLHPGIGDRGRKARGIGEYSWQSAEVHTLPFHQLSWSEVASTVKWALVWNRQGLSSIGLVPEQSGQILLADSFWKLLDQLEVQAVAESYWLPRRQDDNNLWKTSLLKPAVAFCVCEKIPPFLRDL